MNYKLLFLSLCVTCGSAHAVVVGGVNYSLDESAKTAEVIAPDASVPYTGDIVIPEDISDGSVVYKVTAIGRHAFENSSITSIELPGTILKLDQYAFSGCTLEEIVVPDKCMDICLGCFDNTPSLRQITLGRQILSIEGNAFRNTSLENVYVKNPTPFYIVDSAFPADVASNAYLHVPENSVNSYKTDSSFPLWKKFKSTTSLDLKVIDGLYYKLGDDGMAKVMAAYLIKNNDGSQTRYDGEIEVLPTVYHSGQEYVVSELEIRTFYQSKPTSVKLPDTLTGIPDETFWNNTLLEEVVIPNSVTSVGANNFEFCTSLRGVTFGSSVVEIGNNCFTNVDGVTDITAFAVVPPSIGAATFPSDLKRNAVLHVPSGTSGDYMSAPHWDGFKEYVEIEAGPAVGVDSIDSIDDCPVRYYDMRGVEILNPAAGDIVLVRRGMKVSKEIFVR